MACAMQSWLHVEWFSGQAGCNGWQNSHVVSVRRVAWEGNDEVQSQYI